MRATWLVAFVSVTAIIFVVEWLGRSVATLAYVAAIIVATLATMKLVARRAVVDVAADSEE